MSRGSTEVIYAVGAVTVSILGALRFSKCTRIKFGSGDYPAGTIKVVAYVTIEYRATFTEPKPLAAS